MSIMNSFVIDIFDRITHEASKLCSKTNRATLTIRDIQTATILVLQGELSKHAVSEAKKAITKYESSK